MIFALNPNVTGEIPEFLSWYTVSELKSEPTLSSKFLFTHILSIKWVEKYFLIQYQFFHKKILIPAEDCF